jgi:outer membrane biosynthesis protein TonB
MEAMVPESMSVPLETESSLSEVGVVMPAEPSEPVVAQRPEEPEDEDEPAHVARTEREDEGEDENEGEDEDETTTTSAHLPADYHTPEAQAAREAHREEVRAAEEAAAAAAAATAAAEAARAELPSHPDRDAVRESMEAVRSAITACANGAHGTATMRITVHHSGRVQGALVEGTFSGTPEGSCMALAARRARFPAFSEDRFSLTYPFTF